MFRPITSFLHFFLALALTSSVFALQSEPTMDKRGLLGVVLDGQYFPKAQNGRKAVGVRIAEIQPGLAADRADLHNGDIVLSVNEQSVSSVRELQVAIASKKPGSQITLTVSRNEEVFMRSVILGDWFDFLVRTPIFGPFISDVGLRPLNENERQLLQLPAEVNGLLVERVSDRSLYQFVFREGMVITSINGADILSPSQAARAIKEDGNEFQYYFNGIYGSFSLLKE
ncbi:MAG: PDZ domain-containing protein [Opitutales bacterium]